MANFPMIKILLPIFSHNIECDKPQGTFCKGPQAILTITVEFIRAFFLGPESLLKTQFFFLKKGKIPSEKDFVAYLFSFYGVWQTSGENL